MAGHWPSSFSAFLWTETNSHFVMLTDYVSRLQAIFFLAGPKRAIPSGQNSPISPARVANQNTGFALSCPLAEPAI